tara:strand:- start:6325 stop:6927 length:603 start_codon:yes stop_codon:yes gene_type:complete
MNTEISENTATDPSENLPDNVRVTRYRGGELREIRYRDGDGQTHREDGPAVVTYYPNGQIKHEGYYRHSILHREDGPASTSFSPDGYVTAKKYFHHGTLHREEGPAVYLYRDWNEERYYRDGQVHREDGPAFVTYYKDGTVRSEAYLQNDRRHREDGPAEIMYAPNGRVVYADDYITLRGEVVDTESPVPGVAAETAESL